MFHEDRDLVALLKKENKHFLNLFNKHNELDDKIEAEINHLSDVDMETLKKQKLRTKDEMFAMIHDYKNK